MNCRFTKALEDSAWAWENLGEFRGFEVEYFCSSDKAKSFIEQWTLKNLACRIIIEDDDGSYVVTYGKESKYFGNRREVNKLLKKLTKKRITVKDLSDLYVKSHDEKVDKLRQNLLYI